MSVFQIIQNYLLLFTPYITSYKEEPCTLRSPPSTKTRHRFILTHPLSAHQWRFVFRNPLLSTQSHKIQLAPRRRWKFLTRSPLNLRCPRTCSGCSVLWQFLPGVSTTKFRHRIFRPLTRQCHQVELLKDSWPKCEGRYLKEDFDSYTNIQNGHSLPPNGSP